MRRHWMHRVFSIALMAWFIALVAEPVVLHPCPMHDGILLAQSGAAAHGMGDMSMSTARAGVMAHALGHERMPQRHPAGHHHCTCMGNCTATTTAALPATHITLAGALAVAPHDTGLPAHLYIPVAAQHVLPFAHAPPPPPHTA